MSRNNLSNSEQIKSDQNDLNLQKNYTLGAENKFKNVNYNQIQNISRGNSAQKSLN